MNKQEFLARLRDGLSGLPEDDIAERLAFRRAVECTVVHDTDHELHPEHSEQIMVDKGPDSADFRIMNLVQPVFYLYVAAFILLACAETIEYQMTVPKKDAIKPLTLFAVVGSSFYLAVRCIGILCAEPIASLMHRNLMLPMKWKFALLLFAAVELVPFAILAIISHFC